MAATLSYVFGFHHQIRHGIVLHGNKYVLFLAGQMCISHNIETGQQKFSLCPELGYPTALAQGPKHFLAIAERHEDGPRVNMFDRETSVKKALPDPEVNVEEYICLCFSTDFKYLAAQGGPPDWAMVLWIWDKKTIKTVYLPSGMNAEAEIREIFFHPRDNDQIVAVGKQYFRLYKFEEEEGFKPFVFAKYEAHGANLCIGWLPRERLAIGTEDGKVLMFDGIEQRYEIKVADMSGQVKKKGFGMKSKGDSAEESLPPLPVSCMVITSKGLMCTYGNRVVVDYVRTDDNKDYKFKQSFHIPEKTINVQKDLGETEPDVEQIMDMKLDSEEEILVVYTSYGQIYYFPLNTENVTQATRRTFLVLTQPVHKDPIIGMDVAIKRPLLVSCSRKQAIFWDYVNRYQQMQKTFYDEILSVAVHPLGLFLVLGFTEYTRLFTILCDSLQETAVISTTNCTKVSFSNGGHLLAIASGSHIHLYSFITLERLAKLKGHHGTLTAFGWSQNDDVLISGDDKGAIYIWDVNNQQRIAESVVKGSAYSAVCLSVDGKNIYAVGSDKTIRELCQSEIQKEAPTGVEVTALALSHSGHMLFGGTENGCLRAFRFPLTSAAAAVDTRAHLGPVAEITIAFGDGCLMTAGTDGMLAIWEVIDKEKRPKPTVRFLTSVLIDQEELKTSFEKMKILNEELSEMKTETQYQLSIKDMLHEQQKQNIIRKMEAKLSDLNVAVTDLSKEKQSVVASYQQEVTRLKEANQADLDDLELSTRKKLLYEYERYDKLVSESQAKEAALQARVKELEDKIENLSMELISSFEKQITEKDEIIKKEIEKGKQKEQDYAELWKQVEEGNDAELTEVKANFAREIQLQTEEVERLKEANEIARKKILHQQDDIKELKEQMQQRMKEETKLKSVISGLEKDVTDAQECIRDKNSVIQDLQERIFDLHQDRQELEKHEFVSNYSYAALKKETEPKEEEIRKCKKIIEQLNANLETSANAQKKQQMEIDSMADRLKCAEREIKREKLRLSNVETILQRYKSDLAGCSAVIQEPKKLKEYVKKLLEKHVKDRKKETISSDFDLNAEFMHQREHLEKSISVLRKRLQKENKAHRIEYVRMVQENSELIRSINDLRQDLKVANRRIQDMEAALGLSSMEFSIEGSTTRQKLEVAVAAARRKDEEIKLEIDRRDNMIEMQQQEIRRLQALLVVSKEGQIV